MTVPVILMAHPFSTFRERLNFPHERLEPKNYWLYVHPENPNDMFLPDARGNKREWILEIHFVDRGKKMAVFLNSY